LFGGVTKPTGSFGFIAFGSLEDRERPQVIR